LDRVLLEDELKTPAAAVVTGSDTWLMRPFGWSIKNQVDGKYLDSEDSSPTGMLGRAPVKKARAHFAPATSGSRESLSSGWSSAGDEKNFKVLSHASSVK